MSLGVVHFPFCPLQSQWKKYFPRAEVILGVGIGAGGTAPGMCPSTGAVFPSRCCFLHGYSSEPCRFTPGCSPKRWPQWRPLLGAIQHVGYAAPALPFSEPLLLKLLLGVTRRTLKAFLKRPDMATKPCSPCREGASSPSEGAWQPVPWGEDWWVAVALPSPSPTPMKFAALAPPPPSGQSLPMRCVRR